MFTKVPIQEFADRVTGRFVPLVLLISLASLVVWLVWGESLRGVHAAREFVEWYNGHPNALGRNFHLANVETAVLVGNGNVSRRRRRRTSTRAATACLATPACRAGRSLRRSAGRDA